jgi:hypothetical protein
MRNSKRFATVSIGSIALLVCATTAASATTYYPITGTCYESGAWFQSSNVRTVNKTVTSIGIQFATTPSNGVQFYINEYSSGQAHGIVDAPSSDKHQWLSHGDAYYGEEFQNNYALLDPGHQTQYSFKATEDY